MIRGSVYGGDALVDRIERKIPLAKKALTRAITVLTLQLQRRVKLKLSDDVLNVRSGRLRRSINMKIEGADTPKVTGYVGTNVKYARQHEYGETVTVEEHLRLVRKAFGKDLKHPVWSTVKTHKVVYPERSFLRSALREMQPDIKKTLEAAIKDSFK